MDDEIVPSVEMDSAPVRNCCGTRNGDTILPPPLTAEKVAERLRTPPPRLDSYVVIAYNPSLADHYDDPWTVRRKLYCSLDAARRAAEMLGRSFLYYEIVRIPGVNVDEGHV